MEAPIEEVLRIISRSFKLVDFKLLKEVRDIYFTKPCKKTLQEAIDSIEEKVLDKDIRLANIAELQAREAWEAQGQIEFGTSFNLFSKAIDNLNKVDKEKRNTVHVGRTIKLLNHILDEEWQKNKIIPVRNVKLKIEKHDKTEVIAKYQKLVEDFKDIEFQKSDYFVQDVLYDLFNSNPGSLVIFADGSGNEPISEKEDLRNTLKSDKFKDEKDTLFFEAIEEYKKSFDFAPNKRNTQLYYSKLTDDETSEYPLKEVLDLLKRYNNFSVREFLLSWYMENNRFAEAKHESKKLLNGSAKPEALFKLAEIYIKERDYKEYRICRDWLKANQEILFDSQKLELTIFDKWDGKINEDRQFLEKLQDFLFKFPSYYTILVSSKKWLQDEKTNFMFLNKTLTELKAYIRLEIENPKDIFKKTFDNLIPLVNYSVQNALKSLNSIEKKVENIDNLKGTELLFESELCVLRKNLCDELEKYIQNHSSEEKEMPRLNTEFVEGIADIFGDVSEEIDYILTNPEKKWENFKKSMNFLDRYKCQLSNNKFLEKSLPSINHFIKTVDDIESIWAAVSPESKEFSEHNNYLDNLKLNWMKEESNQTEPLWYTSFYGLTFYDLILPSLHELFNYSNIKFKEFFKESEQEETNLDKFNTIVKDYYASQLNLFKTEWEKEVLDRNLKGLSVIIASADSEIQSKFDELNVEYMEYVKKYAQNCLGQFSLTEQILKTPLTYKTIKTEDNDWNFNPENEICIYKVAFINLLENLNKENSTLMLEADKFLIRASEYCPSEEEPEVEQESTQKQEVKNDA